MKIVERFLILGIFALVAGGCVVTKGAMKTSDESLHAESGIGVTVWKIPILGIGGWGTGYGSDNAPQVIINKYDYQAQPAPTPPGAPPPPTSQSGPPPANYPTVYNSGWDDPTLVIFNNRSYRTVRVEIDGREPLRLASYQATTNLHLSPGEHQTRLVIEKPTQANGTLELVRFFKVYIRPEGRSQIFDIYDY